MTWTPWDGPPARKMKMIRLARAGMYDGKAARGFCGDEFPAFDWLFIPARANEPKPHAARFSKARRDCRLCQPEWFLSIGTASEFMM